MGIYFISLDAAASNFAISVGKLFHRERKRTISLKIMGLYQKSQQNKIEPSAEKTVLGSKYLVEFKCEKKTAKH